MAKAPAPVAHFVGESWHGPENNGRINQDHNLVADLRWQFVWETADTLEEPTTLRIEMERQSHRWANFMNILHHLGTMVTMQNFLERNHRASAVEVAKWKVEKLRLRRHLNSIVAGNVMLFHRCCRYMGNDLDGQVNGDRRSFRPDFFAWSEVWYDMMATFGRRYEIFERNNLIFQAEFQNGPPTTTSPPTATGPGSWRSF